MLWHHFLGHSPARKSPWAWLREQVCPSGGPMASIVTMCHVSFRQMQCGWQQHAPSGNCQQSAKNAHLVPQVLLDDMCWFVCVGSMGFHSIPNRHTWNMPICIYIYICIYTSRFKGVPFQFQKLSFLRGAVSTPLSIHEDGAPEKHDFQSQTQGIFLTMVPQESKALPKTFALCFPKKCFSKQNVKFVCVCDEAPSLSFSHVSDSKLFDAIVCRMSQGRILAGFQN